MLICAFNQEKALVHRGLLYDCKLSDGPSLQALLIDVTLYHGWWHLPHLAAAPHCRLTAQWPPVNGSIMLWDCLQKSYRHPSPLFPPPHSWPLPVNKVVLACCWSHVTMSPCQPQHSSYGPLTTYTLHNRPRSPSHNCSFSYSWLLQDSESWISALVQTNCNLHQ